jgi:uncharacterized membrane protein HdeD (DUF308 family)
MIQKPSKNWWLLALCGVLDAIISVIYFNHAGRGFHETEPVVFLGKLTLAAGACTITAAMWSSRNGKSWLLVLNGLACSALGLIFTFWTGPLSFSTVALLIILMAMSIGIYELATARTLRLHVADGWFLGLAGVVSVGFALAFVALGIGWIKVEPGSYLDLLWLGSYFSFSAICKLGLAVRLHSGQWDALPPLGNPKPAH